ARVRRLLELPQQPPLLVRQPPGHRDVDEQLQVPAAATLEDRHALAAEDADLAGLRPGLERELDLALQRRHRHRRAERGLRDRQVDGRKEIVALAREPWVGPDAHEHVQVAGTAAQSPGVTLAAEPDPLAVVDARRDLNRELPLLQHPAGAVAGRARMLDDAADTCAARAGLRPDELAEDGVGDGLQPARAAAGGAG